jgi:hypothetical protein
MVGPVAIVNMSGQVESSDNEQLNRLPLGKQRPGALSHFYLSNVEGKKKKLVKEGKVNVCFCSSVGSQVINGRPLTLLLHLEETLLVRYFEAICYMLLQEGA